MRGVTICIFLLYSLVVNASDGSNATIELTTPIPTTTTKIEPEWIECDPRRSVQCKFGGNCLKNIKTLEYKCNCTNGYTGALCELPAGLNYCYNGGLNKFDAKRNKTTCICISTRYSGEQCQFDSCKNEQKCGPKCYMTSECKCLCGHDCDTSYCNDNGSCTGNSDRDLGCKCNAGYSGPTCYTDDCLGYCFNKGICQRNSTTNSISCACNSGYVSDPRCGVKDLTPVFTTQVHRTKVRETVPSDFTSTRIIMYALSITLFICLISIGGYVAIQRGLLTCLLSPFDAKNMTDNSPLSASYSRRSNFLGGNLGFSKLEEEVEESNGNVQA